MNRLTFLRRMAAGAMACAMLGLSPFRLEGEEEVAAPTGWTRAVDYDGYILYFRDYGYARIASRPTGKLVSISEVVK